MAILDLQRRQRELGRIRMGDRGGKGQPQKLSEFRLTSPAKHLLDHAAALWGGEVKAWAGSPSEGQYELYTKTDRLPIIVPPNAEASQFYEQWTAGGATHRCDGDMNIAGETPVPCSCNPDKRDCKATTRVSVMLPDLPDVGVWRLETHGINAAMELPGTIDVIRHAGESGQFLTGMLRIEHRTSKKAGQTRKFIVPVIDLDVTTRALMSGEDSVPSLGTGGVEAPGESPPVAALPSGQAPGDTVSPGGGGGGAVANGPARTTTAQAQDEPPSPSGDGDGGSPRTISEAQRKRMFAIANEHGVSDDDLKLVVLDQAGVESSKDIPKDRYEAVIAALTPVELVPGVERMEDIG